MESQTDRVAWLGRNLYRQSSPDSLGNVGKPSTRSGCSEPPSSLASSSSSDGTHYFSRHPAPLPHHPHCEESLFYVHYPVTMLKHYFLSYHYIPFYKISLHLSYKPTLCLSFPRLQWGSTCCCCILIDDNNH